METVYSVLLTLVREDKGSSKLEQDKRTTLAPQQSRYLTVTMFFGTTKK